MTGPDGRPADGARFVLMLSYPFPPMGLAGSYRTLRFVQALPTFGWRPIVVTIRAEFVPHYGMDTDLYEAIPPDAIVRRTRVWRPVHTTWQAVKMLIVRARGRRLCSPRPRSRASPTDRWPRLCGVASNFCWNSDPAVGWVPPSFWTAMSLIRRYRPQVVYSTGPPHSSHLTAVLLQLTTGVPAVIDLRDPWSRVTWQPSDRLAAWRRRLQANIEAFCIQHADGVVLNTSELKADFCSHYATPLHSKFHVVTNGYDPGLLTSLRERGARETTLITRTERSDCATLVRSMVNAICGRC